jgi:hypothetical protein
MFGEQITGQFGRVILLAGAQRGGEKGGPACRFVLDGRSGVLLDLGRIDCFAVEPHHHTQMPHMNPHTDSPEERVRMLAPKGEALDLPTWQGCARQAVSWLRTEWTDELREFGWGEWVVGEAEREKAALADAVEAFLLSHPPAMCQRHG